MFLKNENVSQYDFTLFRYKTDFKEKLFFLFVEIVDKSLWQ